MPKSPAELDYEKQLAAETAVRWIPDGARIGVGSGTTVAHFIRGLGRRVRHEGLRIAGIPTSLASRELAQREGIPLLEPERGLRLDFTVDGADEISPSLDLIKGGGGKLFREKVVASASQFLLVIADSSKPVDVLGHGKLPVPVEVVPFAAPWVMDRIVELGSSPHLRLDSTVPVLTDQRNWLLDCRFGALPDPLALAQKLQAIPGVLAHGLFLGIAKYAVIGNEGQTLLMRPLQPPVDATQFLALPPSRESVF